MKDSLSALEKIPIIYSVQKVALSSEIKEKLGPEVSVIAEKNARKLDVYKIIYRSQGHKVVGFIVEPKKGTKLPCIIWNRGGSKDFGEIKAGWLFSTIIAGLAKQGYIVIATQYSGAGGSEGEDYMGGSDIKDVLNLAKILKGYPKADVSRIGMYGHSRGGLMTYLSLARVKWIKAAVVLAAPADEFTAPKFRPGWEKHQKEMYGGSKEEKMKRSALYWTDKFSKKTPVLVMHGTSDWRVNPMDSIRMGENLFKNKIPYRLVMWEGADHGLTEYWPKVREIIYDWFDRFVKNEKTVLPNLKPHGE